MRYTEAFEISKVRAFRRIFFIGGRGGAEEGLYFTVPLLGIEFSRVRDLEQIIKRPFMSREQTITGM